MLHREEGLDRLDLGLVAPVGHALALGSQPACGHPLGVLTLLKRRASFGSSHLRSPRWRSYRVASEPHLGHTLGRRDLELDLVLVLGQVDIGCDLAALEADGKDGLGVTSTGSCVRVAVGREVEVAEDEEAPLERLESEPLGPEVPQVVGQVRHVSGVAVVQAALQGDLEVVESTVNVVVLVVELLRLRDIGLESNLELKATNQKSRDQNSGRDPT